MGLTREIIFVKFNTALEPKLYNYGGAGLLIQEFLYDKLRVENCKHSPVTEREREERCNYY
jgi:hypothetical protein